MPQEGSSSRGMLAMLILLVMVATGAVTINPASPVEQPGAQARPECPEHDFRPALRGAWPGPSTIIPHVGAATNIPEFHDCQQMLIPVGKALTYGPMIAVFATQDQPSAPAHDSLYLVAVVYNYAAAPYAALRIGRHFNCLYLLTADPSFNRAWMRPNGTNPNCRSTISHAAAGPSNLKNVQHGYTPQATPVPSIARWNYDSVSRTQYIDVSCHKRYCRVGAPNFTPANPIAIPESAPGGAAHQVYQAPAWSDDEQLAIELFGVGLVPSGLHGYFFPSPGLEDFDAEPGAFAEPQYVGMIMVRPDGPLTPVLSKALKKYWLHYRLRPDMPTQLFLQKTTDSSTGWKVFFVHGTETVAYDAKRQVNPPHPHMPGTVRWRWLIDDQTTWVRCLQGCCTPETPA